MVAMDFHNVAKDFELSPWIHIVEGIRLNKFLSISCRFRDIAKNLDFGP